MTKYSKFNSTFILRKKHQNTNIGEIFERDWTTLSERHSLERGKKPIYSDGNFLFTTNNSEYSKRKYTNKKWDAVNVSYDSVFDSEPLDSINEVTTYSNDLRDFSYFGSCSELIRSSIEDIITHFPGNLKSTDYKLYSSSNKFDDILPSEESGANFQYQILNNFNIDLLHKNAVLDEYESEYRFLELTWNSYNISGVAIKNYEIISSEYDKCDNNKKIGEVRITDNNNKLYILRVYYSDGEYIIASSDKTVNIEPNNEVFEEYFSNLNGFEKILLNRGTKPLYTCKLVSPVNIDAKPKYVEKSYTWPSDGKYIDISTNSYGSYLNSLIDLGDFFDNVWCDNIYRSMTHEAIKNFDWTFTREIDENVEQENIDGGNRVSNLLRIYGRGFDDLKRYIDGIKLTNVITYDRYNNGSTNNVIDTLNNEGWHLTNIGNFMTNGTKLVSADKWFSSLNTSYVTPEYTNTSFLKNLLLNSKYILRAKGTTSSIEMIMALFGLERGIDYEINEKYYSIKPIDYDSVLEDGTKTIDLITSLNNDIVGTLHQYENEFSGLTIKDINYNGKHVIVPYFDKNEKYYSNLYFQSYGGWGFDGNKYNETLSYLNVVNSIEELCKVNPNSVKLNDIYYVNNITDYINQSGIDPKNISNFFYVKNLYTNDIDSWGNIQNDWSTIVDKTDERYVLYHKAKYLESIITTKFGNNPHIGFGNYDNGENFRNNMKEPFAYIRENNLFSNLDNAEISKKISFSENYTDETIFNRKGRRFSSYHKGAYIAKHTDKTVFVYNKDWAYSDFIEVDEYFTNNIYISGGFVSGVKAYAELYDKSKNFTKSVEYTDIITLENIDINVVKYIRISFYLPNIKITQLSRSDTKVLWKPVNYSKTHSISNESYLEKYYLNDKVVELINYQKDSEPYKKFFNNVILKYVEQVIPSTTILQLKDF